MPTHEHELTAPVDLCTPDGRLNPAAVGWSRTPLHRTHLTGSHLAGSGWGRNKRWEYWLVSTPTHSIALTLADIDYLGLASVHFLEHGAPGDRGPGTPKASTAPTAIAPEPARPASSPAPHYAPSPTASTFPRPWARARPLLLAPSARASTTPPTAPGCAFPAPPSAARSAPT